MINIETIEQNKKAFFLVINKKGTILAKTDKAM